MQTDYIIIDFENIQPDPHSLAELCKEGFRILMFVGFRQSLSINRIKTLQPLGDRLEYIVCEPGRNSLDFHIAYYLGRLTEISSKGSYYLISRDRGYDPLIRHLAAQGVKAKRVEAVEKIFHLHCSWAKPMLEADAEIFEEDIRNLTEKACLYLKSRGNARPRSLKNLSGVLERFFQESLERDQLEVLIQSMLDKGSIRIKDGRVSYSL